MYHADGTGGVLKQRVAAGAEQHAADAAQAAGAATWPATRCQCPRTTTTRPWACAATCELTDPSSNPAREMAVGVIEQGHCDDPELGGGLAEFPGTRPA